MQKISTYKSSLIISFPVIMFFFPSLLFGYLDPGTFSYLGSLLVGFIVGIIVYAKIIWMKVKDLLNRISKRDK